MNWEGKLRPSEKKKTNSSSFHKKMRNSGMWQEGIFFDDPPNNIQKEMP